MIAMMVMIATSTAQAKKQAARSSQSAQMHYQLKRFYHADGYIKAIGKVAHRTIYSSNPKVRHKWVNAVRYLNTIREGAREKILELRLPTRPPHYEQLLCIHGYEGSWTDSGGPYYGGLQMDLGFQSTYAEAYARTWHVPNPYLTLGTADHWTPLVQMWVAEEAIKTRGYGPWPNTARYCGLL